MEKEFCTYEQALALKELGFDEPCFGRWIEPTELSISAPSDDEYCLQQHEFTWTALAPLCQQAFRWFREKYNLVFNFISYNIVKPGEYHWSITWNDEAKAGGIVKTYEEAEQACLDKLIEIVNNKINR